MNPSIIIIGVTEYNAHQLVGKLKEQGVNAVTYKNIDRPEEYTVATYERIKTDDLYGFQAWARGYNQGLRDGLDTNY